MKIIIITFSFILLLLGCGSKNKQQYSIVPKKIDFLEGLSILETQDIDSFLTLNLYKLAAVPFYTKEGELIPSPQKINIISSNDYNKQIYVNEKKEIKAWVVWPRTEEEKRKAPDTTKTPQIKNSLIGKDAIPFSVKDIKGNIYSNKIQNGKIFVFNFWFLDCYPCLKEIPTLNQLVEKYKGKNVLFLGFALDKKNDLVTYLKKNPFNYNIIPNSEAISESYNVKSFPTHIVIDKKFKIQYYSTGLLDSNEKSNLESKIDKLLSN